MIDLEKIKNRIEIIRSNVVELEDMKNLSLEHFSRHKRDVAAAKHFIREAIEAMIDIGAHIVAKRLFGAPASAADVMIVLGEKGAIPREHVETYVRMVKYRNRLVHFYHEVSIVELHNIIQNHLQDFEHFIGDIALYPESNHSEEKP